MKRLLVFGVMLALAGAAMAQTPKPSPRPSPAPKDVWKPMTAAEAKKELFGADLSGTIEGNPGYRWRECIDPKGFTLYQHDGIEERGQLVINDKAQACFSYPPGNKERVSCFAASKTAVGYDFRGAGLIFHATRVRRVQTCDNQNVSETRPARPQGDG